MLGRDANDVGVPGRATPPASINGRKGDAVAVPGRAASEAPGVLGLDAAVAPSVATDAKERSDAAAGDERRGRNVVTLLPPGDTTISRSPPLSMSASASELALASEAPLDVRVSAPSPRPLRARPRSKSNSYRRHSVPTVPIADCERRAL